MKDDDLVALRTFSNLVDAEMAAELLVSQGVRAMVRKDDSGGMRPHLQMTRGVELIVLARDLERAEAVLEATQG